MSKTEDVMAALSEGKSTKEICDETGCSKGLVSQCRKKLADKFVEEHDDDEVSDEELEEAHTSFVNKVKLTPDPEPEPKKKVTYQVACGACDAEWEVEDNERIRNCPYCGVGLQ